MTHGASKQPASEQSKPSAMHQVSCDTIETVRHVSSAARFPPPTQVMEQVRNMVGEGVSPSAQLMAAGLDSARRHGASPPPRCGP